MRKIITSVFLITLSLYANAQQEVKFGPKAGVNFANLSNVSKAKMLPGFYIGVVAEIKLTAKFSFQPELVYSSQGAKNEYSETKMGITYKHHNHDKLDYINIPLLAKYYIMNGFSVELGPQFGFLIKAESKDEISGNNTITEETRDFKNEVNSFDFGIGAGLSYDLPSGLFINARYNFGVTKVGKSGEYYKDATNAVIQAGVGYKF